MSNTQSQQASKQQLNSVIDTKPISIKQADSVKGILQTKSKDHIENNLQNNSKQGKQLKYSRSAFVGREVGNILNEDFSNTRIHSASSATQIIPDSTWALSKGEDIYFAPHTYKPDTTMGEALIAHELTHVKQYRSALKNNERITGESKKNEEEANTTAFSLLSRLHPSIEGLAAMMGQLVKPENLLGGVSFQRCSRSSINLQAPAYLGERSTETFETIQRRIEASESLQDMLLYGPTLVYILSNPLETAATGGFPIEQQAQAIAAVPVILKNRVTQDIQLLLVMHGNELSQQEKQYWNALLERFN